jgi:hypothetical protein
MGPVLSYFKQLAHLGPIREGGKIQRRAKLDDRRVDLAPKG